MRQAIRPVHRVVFCVSLAVAPLSAIPHQTQPAVVRGVAVDASGAPVSGAVAVLLPGAEGDGPSTVPRREAIVSGRFEFRDVPPGLYKLIFATEAQMKEWPSDELMVRLSIQRPLPLKLGPGLTVPVEAVLAVSNSDVVFKSARMLGVGEAQKVLVGPPGAAPLPAGRSQPNVPPTPPAPGVISGRVTDAEGRPVAGLEIRSMRRIATPSGMQLVFSGPSARTDVEGRCQLINRQPDRYIVLALAYSIDLTGGPVSVRRAPPPSAGPDGALVGYLSTYYGGVTDERAASAVVVGTDERSGIDIALVRRKVFEITGSVPGLSLTSFDQRLVVAAVEDGGRISPNDVRHHVLGQDGSFRVPEVPDGEYRLSFTGRDGWNETRVRVAGRAPDPLVLTLTPATRIKGRVEFVGSSPRPTVAELQDPRTFAVEFAPAQLTPGAGFTRSRIRADGTFETSVSGPGPFVLRSVSPSPWFQVSGLVNGVDTLDLPTTANTNSDDATIVFADRSTALLVTVRDDSGRPPVGLGVILFSEDDQYWSRRSRRLQIGRTATGGTASFSNLPPGRYLVAAGPDITPTSPLTRDFIATLKSRAQSVDLQPGESKSLTVAIK